MLCCFALSPSFFFVSNSDGLQPKSNGLQPKSDGLQPLLFLMNLFLYISLQNFKCSWGLVPEEPVALDGNFSPDR